MVKCRLKNKYTPALIQQGIEEDIGLTVGKDAIYESIDLDMKNR